MTALLLEALAEEVTTRRPHCPGSLFCGADSIFMPHLPVQSSVAVYVTWSTRSCRMPRLGCR